MGFSVKRLRKSASKVVKKTPGYKAIRAANRLRKKALKEVANSPLAPVLTAVAGVVPGGSALVGAAFAAQVAKAGPEAAIETAGRPGPMRPDYSGEMAVRDVGGAVATSGPGVDQKLVVAVVVVVVVLVVVKLLRRK